MSEDSGILEFSASGGAGESDWGDIESGPQHQPCEDTYNRGVEDTEFRPSLMELRKNPSFRNASSFKNEDAEEDDGPEVPIARVAPSESRTKFGWTDGVFARCLLNIFGVIMFLRLGWLVGYAGIFFAIVVMLTSVLVTFLTTLSLSSICTNGHVKGGGAYYLISRSLGPSFGGSIGLMFTTANAVAIALYLVGFAETIVNQVEGEIINEEWDLRLIAFAALAILVILCFIGVDWVIKVQLFLLFLLIFSILSFIIGGCLNPTEDTDPAFVGIFQHASCNVTDTATFCPDTDLWRNWGSCLDGDAEQFPEAAELLKDSDGTVDLAVCLAVFFPAVTGIMAGANISGDLKDASVAIPKGTLLAVGVSTVVYVFLALILGFGAVRTVPLGNGEYGGLLHDSILMAKMSFWPPIVYVGIYAATLSSALASLVGAPRILQAVARDDIFPFLRIFKNGYGKTDEPYQAYVFAFIVAAVCISTGDLNPVASLVSGFFMASYALVNFACYSAFQSKSPGWRPTFTWNNRWISLIGTVMSVAMMFFLNWKMAFLTTLIGLALYKWVDGKKDTPNWGAALEGQRYVSALNTIHNLKHTKKHVKNWRPQYLVMSGPLKERPELVCLARALRKGHGMTIFGDVVREKFEDCSIMIGNQKDLNTDEAFLEEKRFMAFVDVIASESLLDGFRSMLQLSGMGRMHPNTAILGFREEWIDPEKRSSAFGTTSASPDTTEAESATTSSESVTITVTDRAAETKDYVEMIGSAFDMKCGVVLIRKKEKFQELHDSLPERAKAPIVDVWWLVDDGGLSVLLPHLLLRQRNWKRGTLRLNCVQPTDIAAAAQQVRMENLMKKFRIRCEVRCFLTNLNPPADQIKLFSDAGVSLPPETIERAKYYCGINDLAKENSQEADLVAFTLPVPPYGTPADVYMAYIDILTTLDQPTMLIRGNQHNVLTFDC